MVGVLGCMAERLKSNFLKKKNWLTWWWARMPTGSAWLDRGSRKRTERRECFAEPRRNLWGYCTRSFEQQWRYCFCKYYAWL